MQVELNNEIIMALAQEIGIKQNQVVATLNLLKEDNTVPFIARYRKEVTGSLDEEQIRVIEKQYKYQSELADRKEEIINLIDEKGMLTEDLKNEILSATIKQQIEDIYLPFKEKKKTKATEAIKQGLEPLAEFILTEPEVGGAIEKEALKYLNEELKVDSVEIAITGALYIIAERISDTPEYRQKIRKITWDTGTIITKAKKDFAEKDPKSKYENYYDSSEAVHKMPGHRTLAINRAEKEKVISVKLEADVDQIINFLKIECINKKSSDSEKYLIEAIEDSYKRLIKPAIEREIRNMKFEEAEERAFILFQKNLDQLIMEKPLKDKTVLAIDPAYRTGCKLAVILPNFEYVKIDVIYPHIPQNKVEEAKTKLLNIIEEFKINQIVIGNGTASRETEELVDELLTENNLQIDHAIISESGASVYSASKLAQKEFPDLEVQERSAISIGRRIIDPMSEIVKIDPKSIGVGQYQHDVNQKKLEENLVFTITKDVNLVGVNVNTASEELLKYVSGLNARSAKGIISLRQKLGKISDRETILKASYVTDKVFEQAAGFLKVLDSKNKLDETFIHPEKYDLARQIMNDHQIEDNEIGTEQAEVKLQNLNFNELAAKYNESAIVIEDIIKALAAPSIDPRQKISKAKLSKTIKSIEDIKQGQIVEGVIRNIVDFGAFVDIGIKNDGLVHISEVSNEYIRDITDALEVGQIYEFKVIDVDIDKGRVGLSLKQVEK